jgi:hypothetical protein
MMKRSQPTILEHNIGTAQLRKSVEQADEQSTRDFDYTQFANNKIMLQF